MVDLHRISKKWTELSYIEYQGQFWKEENLQKASCRIYVQRREESRIYRQIKFVHYRHLACWWPSGLCHLWPGHTPIPTSWLLWRLSSHWGNGLQILGYIKITQGLCYKADSWDSSNAQILSSCKWNLDMILRQGAHTQTRHLDASLMPPLSPSSQSPANKPGVAIRAHRQDSWRQGP